MTRKSVLTLAAIIALGGMSLATDASAQHHGGGGGGGAHFGGGGGAHFGGGGGAHFGGGGAHFGGGKVGAGRFATGRGPRAPAVAERGPGVRVAPGYGARAFVPGGHRRHFWRGRWWYYGVGPCWVWSDYYGEYVWACD
jgi:hypothetical protein